MPERRTLLPALHKAALRCAHCGPHPSVQQWSPDGPGRVLRARRQGLACVPAPPPCSLTKLWPGCHALSQAALQAGQHRLPDAGQGLAGAPAGARARFPRTARARLRILCRLRTRQPVILREVLGNEVHLWSNTVMDPSVLCGMLHTCAFERRMAVHRDRADARDHARAQCIPGSRLSLGTSTCSPGRRSLEWHVRHRRGARGRRACSAASRAVIACIAPLTWPCAAACAAPRLPSASTSTASRAASAAAPPASRPSSPCALMRCAAAAGAPTAALGRAACGAGLPGPPSALSWSSGAAPAGVSLCPPSRRGSGAAWGAAGGAGARSASTSAARRCRSRLRARRQPMCSLTRSRLQVFRQAHRLCSTNPCMIAHGAQGHTFYYCVLTAYDLCPSSGRHVYT